MTKRQRQREEFAKMCEQIGGKNNQSSKNLRAINRRVEKAKRVQHKHTEGEQDGR